MKIEIGEPVDKLVLDENQVGYDDKGNIYDIYYTKGSYTTGFNTVGRIMSLVADGKKVCSALPMFSPPEPYKVISKKELKMYSELYSKLNSKS